MPPRSQSPARCCFGERRSRGLVQERTGVIAELRDGWHAVRERAWVWATILGFCIALLVALAPFFVLGAGIGESVYGSSAVYGIANRPWGVGTVAGAVTGAKWRPRFPMRAGLIACAPWSGVVALFALGPPLPVLYVGMAAGGIGIGLFQVWWETGPRRTDSAAPPVARLGVGLDGRSPCSPWDTCSPARWPTRSVPARSSSAVASSASWRSRSPWCRGAHGNCSVWRCRSQFLTRGSSFRTGGDISTSPRRKPPFVSESSTVPLRGVSVAEDLGNPSSMRIGSPGRHGADAPIEVEVPLDDTERSIAVGPRDDDRMDVCPIGIWRRRVDVLDHVAALDVTHRDL